jgi:hypothetical protein
MDLDFEDVSLISEDEQIATTEEDEKEDIAVAEGNEDQSGWYMHHDQDNIEPENLKVCPPSELDYEPMDIGNVEEAQMEAHENLEHSDEDYDGREEFKRQGIAELLTLPPSLQTPEEPIDEINEDQDSADGGGLLAFIRNHIQRILAVTLRLGRAGDNETAQLPTGTDEKSSVEKIPESTSDEEPELPAQPFRLPSPSSHPDEVIESFVLDINGEHHMEERDFPIMTSSPASTRSTEASFEYSEVGVARPPSNQFAMELHSGDSSHATDSARLATSLIRLPKSIDFVCSSILEIIANMSGHGAVDADHLQDPLQHPREHPSLSTHVITIDSSTSSASSSSSQSLSSSSDASNCSAISGDPTMLRAADPEVFAQVLRAIQVLIMRHAQRPLTHSTNTTFTNNSNSSSASSDNHETSENRAVDSQLRVEVERSASSSANESSLQAPPVNSSTPGPSNPAASATGRYCGRGTPKKHKRASVSLRDYVESESARTLRPRKRKAEELQELDSMPLPIQPVKRTNTRIKRGE